MARFGIVFALVLSACTGSSASGITASELTCPPDSTLTYETFGQAFLDEHCMSCHASKERPTLGSLDAVQRNNKAIVRAAVTSTSMPKGASMSDDERAILGEWLTCGAP